MERSPDRIARDYNHSPARAVRESGDTPEKGGLLGRAWRWVNAPSRRWWAIPLVAAVALFWILLPFDGEVSRFATRLAPRGDVRRELEAAQQYGAIGSVLVTAAVIALLDPGRRRRLLDLAAAVVLTGTTVALLKATIGRPRPKFGDPHHFLSPWGVYPLPAQSGVRERPELHHAWEFWNKISSDLWSFPSSHTAYAVMLSVFLAALYPRLRPLVAVLAAVVGLCRILFGAHYPTDVVAGAVVGLAIAGNVVRNQWGVRALDWFWIRFVNRDARPAYRKMEPDGVHDRPGPAPVEIGSSAADR